MRMKRPSPSTRTVVGLLLLGVLGAAIFWHVWPVATAISVPDVLRPLSEAHPRFILVWINLLYLGTAIVSLLPGALVWMLNVGERPVTSAMLASIPLIGLLLGDVSYGSLAFDFDFPTALLLWDGSKILLAAIGLFTTLDVVRRLTTRSSRSRT